MKKIFFILLFWCGVLYAQHPVSIHLTEKDGLPDIEFYDMVEDDKGFMWFACNNGLYRYDGREFKNYTNSEKRGLSVFNLKFDNQKRLWCTNITGQFFYVEKDSLHLAFDASKEIQSERLHAFNFYDDNLIAYAANIIFRKKTGIKEVKVLGKKENKATPFYYRASVIKNDTIFFLKTNIKQKKTVVEYLTQKTGVLQNYVQFTNKELAGLYKHKNKLIYQQRQSKDVFKRALVTKNKVTNLESFSFENLKLINNFFVEKDDVWFLTEKGLEVFSQKKQLNVSRVKLYFPEKFITKVVKDKQNNYWISTLRNGVFVMPNIEINFYNLKDNIGNITAIENVNNTYIYFGTTLGWLGIYDIKNKKTNYIKFDNNVARVRHILYNKVLNDVYIATNNNVGSHIVDAVTNRVYNSNKGRRFGGAKSMVLLNNGSLFSSLIYGHTITTFSKSKIKTSKFFKLRGKRVHKTHYSTNTETLYIGNVDELIAYDKNFNPTIIRYKNRPIFARGITQTNNGIVWVSTFKDGLLAIKDNKVIKAYTVEDGLLSNQTNYIQADENSVWITSKIGLQLLNTQTNTFKNLTKEDGIDSFKINGIEVIGNTVWYGSNLGLFSFDKTKVFKMKNVTEPYFTSVTITDSIHAIKPNYEVGYNDKRIKFSFNTNGFKSAENTHYQYKLKGLNNNWQNLTKGINEVSFNSLEKGNYTFQLRTISGEKTSNIQQVNFKVEEVFYKQRWFIILLSLGLLLYVIYYYRQRLEKQEREQKLALEKQQNEAEKTFLKLENLRSQMNPHFVFNALNSIQDYIIHNQKDLAGDYLGKFADLIRLYLDQSSKKEISLFEEIDTLKRYLELEKLRFEDKLDYKVFIEETIHADVIFIPTMLLQPYIENSLKHGLLHKKGRGSLVVTFKLNSEKNILICIIIDDGVGRKKSKLIQQNRVIKHKSFATKATQNRLQLLNYNKKRKIIVQVEDLVKKDNLEDSGTKVTIQIPLQVSISEVKKGISEI